MFVVGYNPLSLSQLFLLAFILLYNRLLVSRLHLCHHVLDSFLLTLGHGQVFLLLLLDVCQKLGSFTFTELDLSDPFIIALLDLLDDHLGPLLACNNSLFFPVFLVAQSLESFDFHQKIQFSLLGLPVLLEGRVLCELLVSYSHHLRVEHHFVHVLHVIVGFVHLSLGVGQHRLGFELVMSLNVRLGQFGCSADIVALHARSSGLSRRHLLVLLLLHESALLRLLFLGLYLRRVLDALELHLRNHGAFGIRFFSLSSLLSELSFSGDRQRRIGLFAHVLLTLDIFGGYVKFTRGLTSKKRIVDV